MATNSWNQETKGRLHEKINSNLQDVGSLARQLLRGSKSVDHLDKAAKNFAFQESAIINSYETLQRMGLATSHLQFQVEAIEKNVHLLIDVQDQLRHMQS